MATTAYSHSFQRELDVEQIAALLGEPIAAGAEPSSILRDQVREDVVCSSCGAAGAQIVLPARSKATGAATRRAHFRFVGQTGEDAHSPFCEFYEDGDTETRERDQLVDFGKAKSKETVLVRELVCRAIGSRILGQPDIRAMRQFFFDLKANSRRQVTATPEQLALVWKLTQHRSGPLQRQFHPSHADLPEFEWKAAARFAFSTRHEELIRRCWRLFSWDASRKDRALGLINRHGGAVVFDTSVLRPYYDNTVEMCAYVARFGGLGYSDTQAHNLRHKGTASPLLAFCALLLSMTGWDIDAAIAMFVRIQRAPLPYDTTLGNVIGLNPFHDYLAWSVVQAVGEIAAEHPGMDYEGEMAAIEQQMREGYRVWKVANP